MTDEDLRDAYGELLRQPPDAGDEVSPEELRQLVDGRGPEAVRLAILDRVMRSDSARREFELLRATAAAAGGRPRVAFPPWLGVAAAAVVLVGAGLAGWLLQRAEAPVFRTPAGGAQVELAAPAEGATAPFPQVFAWSPVPGASRYRVEVLDAQRAEAWSAETPDTTASAGARIPAGDYLWRVEALMRDGTLRHSAVRRLRVPAATAPSPPGPAAVP